MTYNIIKHSLTFMLRQISVFLCSFVPKQKKLVLCTAWFGQKYIDNPKYVYEFLLEHSDYNVVWMTHSHVIYNQLRKEGKPVAFFNTLHGIILQIRAQAIFSTVQLSEFNSFFLSKVIHIDLGHGHPIKDSGAKSWDSYVFKVESMYLKHNYFHAICASQFAAEKLLEIVPTLNINNVFISDSPRNDVFVNKNLQKGKNQVVLDFKKGRKAIVYMPTQRSSGNKYMHMDKILPLKEIQSICEKYNCVFIIKKHFYHRNETEQLDGYSNILDITNIDNIDPQVLLCQADILITDYSACYIDFMLLNRPMLFYQYDFDDFQLNERSLYFPFKSLNIAPIAYNHNELIYSLINIISSENDEFCKNRNSFAPTYFANLKQKDGCLKVKKILDKLMRKYYSKS